MKVENRWALQRWKNSWSRWKQSNIRVGFIGVS